MSDYVVTVKSDGDSSVGIPGSNASVILGIDDSNELDSETRLFIKTELAHLFRELWDEEVDSIYISDECPDCEKKVDKEGNCNTIGCPG